MFLSHYRKIAPCRQRAEGTVTITLLLLLPDSHVSNTGRNSRPSSDHLQHKPPPTPYFTKERTVSNTPAESHRQYEVVTTTCRTCLFISSAFCPNVFVFNQEEKKKKLGPSVVHLPNQFCFSLSFSLAKYELEP